MFHIWYTNFGYGPAQSFASEQAAIAYGKSKGFDFHVYDVNGIVVAWSPIGGLRRYVS